VFLINTEIDLTQKQLHLFHIFQFFPNRYQASKEYVCFHLALLVNPKKIILE
tara:strand:+ start:211 stop:366 length:156 start_codon:yes stop_codon:yes gene_type:complete